MEQFIYRFKSDKESHPPMPIIITNKEFEVLKANDYVLTRELLDKLQSEE